MLTAWKSILAIAAVLCCAPLALADTPQEWELVNPSGEIERFAAPPAARIGSLDGKNIVLRWNGKHNGNIVLDRLAELLAEKIPSATVIKSYELNPAINTSAAVTTDPNRAIVRDYIVGLKPDIVITSQAD